jgi:hypothetical protein
MIFREIDRKRGREGERERKRKGEVEEASPRRMFRTRVATETSNLLFS